MEILIWLFIVQIFPTGLKNGDAWFYRKIATTKVFVSLSCNFLNLMFTIHFANAIDYMQNGNLINVERVQYAMIWAYSRLSCSAHCEQVTITRSCAAAAAAIQLSVCQIGLLLFDARTYCLRHSVNAINWNDIVYFVHWFSFLVVRVHARVNNLIWTAVHASNHWLSPA